jgi:hypothetical protein
LTEDVWQLPKEMTDFFRKDCGGLFLRQETACCAQGEQTAPQGMSQSKVMLKPRMLVAWPHASGSRKELHILCKLLRFASRVCHSRTIDS